MIKRSAKLGGALIIFLVTVTLVVLWFRADSLTRYEALLRLRVPESIVSTVFHDEAKIQYLLGNLHLGGAGRYDLVLAEKYYDRAVSLEETIPFLHYQRARIYFLTMRYRTAIAEVNKEIERDPDFSRSYYLRGLIYGYDRQFENAARDFSEFVRRQPDEWAGYNDLAWVLFQLGDYVGVKEAMERVLAKHRNAWLVNSYGVALLNLGELKEAKEAFLEAKILAEAMTPEVWGLAYIGNDPRVYGLGLEDMRKNINANLELVEKRLSESN